MVEEFKDKKICGFFTPEIIENGKRVGFFIENISTGSKKVFAHVSLNGVKFGKYKIDVKVLNEILKNTEECLEGADIIFIDEIGKMEFFSEKFRMFLNKILETKISVVATVHRALTNEVRGKGKLIWLTREKRDEKFEEIKNYLKNSSITS